MIGPGKYDDLCTKAREDAKARGAILIIIDGERGAGFSCQADLAVLCGLPAALRSLANQIEGDLTRGQL